MSEQADRVPHGGHGIFVYRLGIGPALDLFLVAGVATILIIRTFLASTGYPQLGGEGLHIAHMLWGGLLMVIAIAYLVLSTSRRSIVLAALVGGAGWGFFIDEVGKFVTSDNNYFFRPAVAIIYVSFLVLYLVFRAFETRITRTADIYLANAFEVAKEAVVRHVSAGDLERAEAYLRHCDPEDPRGPTSSNGWTPGSKGPTCAS